MSFNAVAFVGPHNSGKTGLIVRLSKLAAGRGLSIGILKRAARPLVFDRAGKDSERYASTGASVIITQAPGMLFIIEPQPLTTALPQLLRRYAGSAEIWFVESYVPEEVPWVRVARRGQHAPSLDRHCVATVGARDARGSVPGFRLDRPLPLFEYLQDSLLKGTGFGPS